MPGNVQKCRTGDHGLCKRFLKQLEIAENLSMMRSATVNLGIVVGLVAGLCRMRWRRPRRYGRSIRLWTARRAVRVYLPAPPAAQEDRRGRKLRGGCF